jgi:preprotein translocase subunit SecA
MNDQRKVIFDQRIEMMSSEDLSETVDDMRFDVVEDLVAHAIPDKAYPEQWAVEELHEAVREHLNLDIPVADWAKEEGIDEEHIRERILEAADKLAAERTERFGADVMRYVEKNVVLQTLDHLWREHLVNLDHLRSVVGFRGYAQRDPLNEYKTESFELFQTLLSNLRQAVTGQMMRVELVQDQSEMDAPEMPLMEANHADIGEFEEGDYGTALMTPTRAAAAEGRNPDDPATWGKVGRNEPCPCGSGKKFKHCHGRIV